MDRWELKIREVERNSFPIDNVLTIYFGGHFSHMDFLCHIPVIIYDGAMNMVGPILKMTNEVALPWTRWCHRLPQCFVLFLLDGICGIG